VSGAHQIGQGIEIYDEVEEFALDQFVVFQNALNNGDLITFSQGQTQSTYRFRESQNG